MSNNNMNVIQFLVSDKYYSELLYNLLKAIPYVRDLKTYDIDLKEDELFNASVQDINTFSLYAVNKSFDDLGSDEDFKEWIESPEL